MTFGQYLYSINIIYIIKTKHGGNKVTKFTPNKKVEWECINSIQEWIGTYISFELEKKGNHILLLFTHGGWKEVTDTFAACNYDWALSIKSLKSLCETGTGTPHQNK